jgi:hypothetical protein
MSAGKLATSKRTMQSLTVIGKRRKIPERSAVIPLSAKPMPKFNDSQMMRDRELFFSETT